MINLIVIEHTQLFAGNDTMVTNYRINDALMVLMLQLLRMLCA